jgi:hypothetical protein
MEALESRRSPLRSKLLISYGSTSRPKVSRRLSRDDKADWTADYVDSLNKELDMFRDLFNRRVKYFAALQEISDSVRIFA